ncbi:MAG: PaaI family thioesterase [Sphingomonadaceae bacterium]
MDDNRGFISEPDPDNPGWLTWELLDKRRFNGQVLGKMIVRKESESKARLRMFPGIKHSNLSNNVHGGITLAFIDVSLFGASRMFGLIEAGTAVTLDLSTQFIGAGAIDIPLEAEVELLKETGRLLFLRGLIVQGDNRIAAFAGTIRKPTKR